MSAQIIYEDPSRGLSLQSVRDPNLEVTRYLFFAGQVIDPTRVKQLDHIRRAGGGEEVETSCFRRTPNNFLPRAFLTPLEVWAKALPPELIGEGSERDAVVIVGQEPPAQRPGAFSNRPGFFLGKSLRHVKFYPGDEIKSILSANEGKGIVEIPSLKGHKWWMDEEQATAEGKAPQVPGVPQRLNAEFFPVRPVELRLLTQMIEEGGEKTDFHRTVAEEMLQGCTQFRVWAETRLSIEHGLLRERKTHHYVHSYSPVARELLRQLEMQPQDRILENNAEEYRELIKAAMAGRGGDITPELVAQIATQVATSILVAQKQAAEATQAQPEATPVTEATVEAPKTKRPRKEENANTPSDSGGE